MTTALRVRWPALISDPAVLTTAYAVQAVQFQVAMVTGPLIVAVLLPLGGPTVAVVAAAVLACAGAALFAAASRPGAPRPDASQPDASQPDASQSDASQPRTSRPSGADLTESGAPDPSAAKGSRKRLLVTVLACAAATGVTSGVISVAVPDVAATALTGVLFAALAGGELVGGILYGLRWTPTSIGRRLSLRMRPPRAHRSPDDRAVTTDLAASRRAHNPNRTGPVGALPLGLVGTAAGSALLAATAGSSSLMPAAMAATGLALAPTAIAASALLDEAVETARLARAYTLLVAVGLAGVASGSSIAGVLSATTGGRTALLVAGAPPTAAAIGVLLQRRARASGPPRS